MSAVLQPNQFGQALVALVEPGRRERVIQMLAETDLIDGLRHLVNDLRARNDRASPYDNGVHYALRRVEDFLDGRDYTQHYLPRPHGTPATR